MTIQSDQTAIFNFLGDPGTHHICEPVRRFNTHGACVFLAGNDAYKIKRAVSFPYMDFTTIEKRASACRNEIAVNCGNAPELYIGAVPITCDAAGLHIGGNGRIVEWAVHMRRFDEECTLDRLAERGELDSNIMDQLALVVSDSHRRAPKRVGASAAIAVCKVIRETLQELEGNYGATTAEIASLRDNMLDAYAKNEALLVRRGLNGKVRRCHGDLHLGNILFQAGAPVLFDAIEFSEDLATIDILYDLAFLIMDLWGRGLYERASRLLNRYLWLSADESEEIEGLALLPLFLALRATIRAKVLAAQAALGAAFFHDRIRNYLQAAGSFMKPSPPRFIAIGGLSGTGKTRIADAFAFRIGAPPGALHLRSDIERKRIYGVAAQSRLPVTAYDSTASESVYRRLRGLAEIGLRSGRAVIMDATLRDPKERTALKGLGASANVPLSGLWLEAPSATRMSRVHDRAGDASDATSEVAESQAKADIGAMDWPKVDASRTIESVIESASILLGLTNCSTCAQAGATGK